MTFFESFLRKSFPLKHQNVNRYVGLDEGSRNFLGTVPILTNFLCLKLLSLKSYNFLKRPVWNRLINNSSPCILTIRVFDGWILKINSTKICLLTLLLIFYSLIHYIIPLCLDNENEQPNVEDKSVLFVCVLSYPLESYEVTIHVNW